MRGFQTSGFFLVLCGLALGGVAEAASITLESVASASVYVYTPPRPGCAGTCEVNPFRVEVFRESGVDERGIVEFDVSALDPDDVTSAVVVLNFNRYSNPSGATRTWEIAAYGGDGLLALDDWGAGTDIANGVPFVGEPIFSFDVTAALVDHLRRGDEFVGFSIRQREEIENSSADFLSLHHLVVAVPEPASGALMLLGLALALCAPANPRNGTQATWQRR